MMQIANKFDSELCGSLPVHRINLIQPYGYLLVLEKDSLQVIQCSENIEELTGQAAADLVQESVTPYIKKADAENLVKLGYAVSDDLPITIHFIRKGKDQECTAIVHVREKYLIVEVEQVQGQYRPFMDVYQRIRYSMAAINKEDDVEQACHAVVRELKEFSRYQSVLMYRFDQDWNGTVIAEINDRGTELYYGLKFPASDIPSQVRKLYEINPYRYIPTRNYDPVKLYPVINPVDQSLLDLSTCNVRSVASVHLEYLENMNVAASMSIRVLVNGRLWGLISCHHPVPKYLTYQQRSVFELLSGIISSKITGLMNNESFNITTRLNIIRGRLIDQLHDKSDWRENILTKEANVAQLMSAGGAAIIYDGKTSTTGEVPSDDDLENLMYWLQAKNIDKISTFHNLPELNEEAVNYAAVGSGIMVLPINKEAGDYIIGFRPEIIRTVAWGGNPYEAIQFEADGKRYHPRASFKKWIEIVKLTSKLWRDEEIAVAESFRAYLLEHLLKLSV